MQNFRKNHTMGIIFRNFGAIMAATLLFLCGCGRSEFRGAEGMIWHTQYHITYDSDRDLTDSIITTMQRVDESLNVFDSTSMISRVNRGEEIELDIHLANVYNESVRINKLTNGAFDPTLGPLITAWGFGKGHKATADTLRLDSLMAFTGISKTSLHKGRLTKQDARTQFNFSAIAKGYGCDEVSRMLARNGVADRLVEIGGEISCAGKSPSGKKWRVSVDRPILTDSVIHESQCVIEITDCGLATSGNYRNFHTSAGGWTYGHTISARTGRPVLTDVLSATVVAPTCMEADALATSMMALGSEGATKLAATLNYPIMLVLNDMSVWENEKFKSLTIFEK